MRRIVVLAASAALLFAGCGSDDDSEPAAPTSAATEAPAAASTLAIAADPGGAKAFTETSLTAAAGSVEIDFANESQLPHAVTIEGNGVDATTETVTGADAPPLTVELAPGEYTFYCPVGDHRAEGMEGTLTVQ